MELGTVGQTLTEVKIQRDIFKGYLLSQFLFVMAMMPPTYLLKKCTIGKKFTQSLEKINIYIMMKSRYLSYRKKKVKPNADYKNGFTYGL